MYRQTSFYDICLNILVGQSCLVCIARRLSITEKTNTMLGIEQFTTKQDTNGKILAFDTRYVLYLLQGMSYI